MEEKEEEIKKTCRICGVEKTLDEFFRGNCKYQRMNVCKVCFKPMREHARQLNIGANLKRQREYYQQRKDFMQERWNTFYYSHKDEESTRKKEFYKNNRIQILKKQKRFWLNGIIRHQEIILTNFK